MRKAMMALAGFGLVASLALTAPAAATDALPDTDAASLAREAVAVSSQQRKASTQTRARKSGTRSKARRTVRSARPRSARSHTTRRTSRRPPRTITYRPYRYSYPVQSRRDRRYPLDIYGGPVVVYRYGYGPYYGPYPYRYFDYPARVPLYGPGWGRRPVWSHFLW